MKEIADALFYIQNFQVAESDDLSIGFHRLIEAREKELNNMETTKRNYHITNDLKNVFGFVKHQEIASYGLRYKLTF